MLPADLIIVSINLDSLSIEFWLDLHLKLDDIWDALIRYANFVKLEYLSCI